MAMKQRDNNQGTCLPAFFLCIEFIYRFVESISGQFLEQATGKVHRTNYLECEESLQWKIRRFDEVFLC